MGEEVHDSCDIKREHRGHVHASFSWSCYNDMRCHMEERT